MVAIARLGGYLEHRHKTPIGIQVLWRGWLKLHDLCVRVASRREGWQLARET
ncbi:Transposase [Nostoc sphaeroides CCNUC1]|uniref:Transposase n=1 Tax=Nostoc sphaeroides CCNUC1 TaxID=2653204 RepID=A0A5P8WCM0_9NOSO|nr:Transposase [Nostoc sphaeroides CCNUC1]